MSLARQHYDHAAGAPEDDAVPWFIREVRGGDAGAEAAEARHPADATRDFLPASHEPDVAATPINLTTRRDRRTDRLMKIWGGALAVGAAFLLGWTIAPTPRETAPRLASAPPPLTRTAERPILPLVVVPDPPSMPAPVEPDPPATPVAGAEPMAREAPRAVPVTSVPPLPEMVAAPERVAERSPPAPIRARDPVRVATAEPRDLLPTGVADVVTVAAIPSPATSAPREPRALPRCKGFQVYRPTSPCTNAPSD